MIVFVDSSALVKRYVVETGSVETDLYLGAAQIVGAAAITVVEGIAAISKCLRRGSLTASDANLAIAALEADWHRITEMPVESPVLFPARRFAQLYGLRGYDAVQLAAALAFQSTANAPIEVATFDVELRAASLAEGLTVWPPSLTSGLTPAPISP